MKKKVFYLPLILLAILGSIQFGCSDDDDGEICESFDAQCDAPDLATYCCTDNTCHYEYKGKTYDNSESGMDDLIADMCGISDKQASAKTEEIKALLKAKTEKLFAEVRSSVICK
jgi:hypothetical protein